jgi:hypothetical protein
VQSRLTQTIDRMTDRWLTLRPAEARAWDQLAGTPRMADTARSIERRFPAMALQMPSPMDLVKLWQRVDRVWRDTGSLDSLVSRDRRWLPHLLFDDPGERSAFGRSAEFTNHYLQSSDRAPRASESRALVFSFFLLYPRHFETFRVWRNGVRSRLRAVQRGSLARWRNAVWEHHLLEEDGPERVARLLLQSDRDPMRVLDELGFTPQLQSGRFVQEVLRAALKGVAASLRSAQASESLLERINLMLRDEARKPRFEALRVDECHALLLPFVEEQPPEEVGTWIQEFLISAWGDPRLVVARWNGVSSEARSVLLRWLTGATLRFFLEILDRTADRIWKYRRSFWQHYLDLGVIEEAWPVLGTQARGHARSIRGSEFIDHGHLYGAMPNQSVLLMKIGDVIVAEWSHSGRCRLWRDDDPNAPVLFQREYPEPSSRGGPRAPVPDIEAHGQTHHGSEYGNWQRSLARKIQRMTGIEPPKTW